MATNTLSILKPSVNNLTTRIFVRAAGLDFEEVDVWGKKGDARVPRQGPGRPDAAARGGGPAEGRALGELRDHAVPLQQARPRPLLPDGPRRAGDGRQRDVLPDRDALSAGRAGDLPDARLPAVRGRGRHRGRRRRAEGAGAAGRARPRSPGRSTSTARSSSTASAFIGGDTPSIADIRLAATLEFLRAIDYDFPAWAEEYMAAMEDSARRRLLGAGRGRPRLHRG